MVSPAHPRVAPLPTSRTSRRAFLLHWRDPPPKQNAAVEAHVRERTQQSSGSAPPLTPSPPWLVPCPERRRSFPKCSLRPVNSRAAMDFQNLRNPSPLRQGRRSPVDGPASSRRHGASDHASERM